MGNTAYINATDLTEAAFTPLPGGRNAFDTVIDYAGKLPGVGEIVVLAPEGFSRDGNFTLLKRGDWNIRELLDSFVKTAGDADHLFYMYGDCPLLDVETAEKMYANHQKYFAQYTFADGYPYGLTPEIIRCDVLPLLQKLSGEENLPLKRDALFTLIQKDINAFDIETFLSPEDFRLMRVSLTCDSKRNTLQTDRIIQAGGTDAAGVMKVMKTRQELLRTLPSFINIQIIDGCPQACSYCPFPQFGGEILVQRNEMPLSRFESILEQTKTLCGEATIGLGLWGEPALHSGLASFVRRTLETEGIDILIETSGIGWKEETLQEIAGMAERDPALLSRLWWIVSLDALDEGIYKTLRGEGMREAYAAAGRLMELFPERVWVQAVRMKDNEDDMEPFFREWKKKTAQVIIQKYDHFCGVLEKKKVTDLSPVKRFPCWHIKRDLSVLIDGKVPLCREDIGNTYSLGNVFDDGLETVWNRGSAFYEEHVTGRYNRLCEVCDEYYTYNF